MTAKEFEQVTMSALRNGSVDSYCLCYDLYFKVLCSYANTIVRDPVISEEIIQNLFLEIWQYREKLPENTSLRAYLLTAVRNDCLDHLKHRKIEKKYAEEYLQSSSVYYENIISDLIDSDLQKILQSAIDKLSARCKEVFMMSRFNYMSYKEISEKLGISIKTVENQIVTALRILRKELDPIL